jgi:shikimate kinase
LSPEHIIFVGFMGAGKTSVALRVAALKGMDCIDMDSYLERGQELSVADIFAVYGEGYFRQLETDFLKGLLTRERTVLSTGGGVVKRAENRALLKAAGTVVYLKVDADEALRRIGDVASRPMLLAGRAPQQLLKERQPLYEQVADVVIDTNGLDVAAVAKRAIEWLYAKGRL